MWRRRKPKIFLFALGCLLAFLIFGLPSLFRLMLNIWWFESVGYRQVFATILLTKIMLFLVFTGASFFLVPAQLILTLKFTPHQPNLIAENLYEMRQRTADTMFLTRLLFLAGSLFALLIGLDAANRWQNFLLFSHHQLYGIVDPIFKKEVGFYIFKLPFYRYFNQTLLVMLVSALLITTIYYVQMKEVRWARRGLMIFQPARGHLLVLLALLALAAAAAMQLQRYNFLFQSSRSGNFPGAGFADVYFAIPALNVLSWACLGGAVVAAVTIFLRSYFTLTVYFGLLLGAYLLGTGVIPSFVQRFLVESNELAREKPFISHALKFTRRAYGIDSFRETEYKFRKAPQNLLKKYKAMLDNIRLWDHRPYRSTIQQLQTLLPYYTFVDVDFDRYRIDGRLVQVAVALREIDHSRLPQQAQRAWISRHFTYTHGIGAVVSPVSEYRKEGLPAFLMKDIPPTGKLVPESPQIYFGEQSLPSHYVFVNGKERELDYLIRGKQVYTQYRGKGGVPLSSFWRRLVAAYLFQDFKILISQAITEKTRLLLVRDIKRRVRKIAPYLIYDSDPYPVMGKDHIYWIIDAYTASGYYPYSAKTRLGERNHVNIVRNSLKVVVDAYDGTVQFFVVDPKDPLIKAYRAVFPDLYQPISAMPEEIREHIRYPLDLLKVQALHYRLYHTRDPELFYSRQDVWAIPEEIYQEERIPMEPYYVMLQQKPEAEPVFSLMLPLTPERKPNMTAWISAFIKQDKLQPEIKVYRFPKDRLTYGPMQIESRIDNNTEISEMITLLGQKGSQVVRGNLLVIPIGGSLLYVEPVYLQAEQNQIPELKKIILATADRVVMGETLEDALSRLGDLSSEEIAETDKPLMPRQDTREVKKFSLEELIRQADQALRKGDLEAFGKIWNRIRKRAGSG